MISTLRACSISDTPALERPTGVGGNPLPFDCGNPVNSENTGGLGHATAYNPPHWGSLGNLFDICFGLCGIAKFKHADVVKHTNCTANLNSIKAQFVATPVHPGDGIKIVNSQIG